MDAPEDEAPTWSAGNRLPKRHFQVLDPRSRLVFLAAAIADMEAAAFSGEMAARLVRNGDYQQVMLHRALAEAAILAYSRPFTPSIAPNGGIRVEARFVDLVESHPQEPPHRLKPLHARVIQCRNRLVAHSQLLKRELAVRVQGDSVRVTIDTYALTPNNFAMLAKMAASMHTSFLRQFLELQPDNLPEATGGVEVWLHGGPPRPGDTVVSTRLRSALTDHSMP